MARTRNDRAMDLFDEAAELPPERRGAFLDDACAGDADLRREVELLLAADDTAGAFLSNPAYNPAEVAAKLLGEENVGTRIGHYRLAELIGEGGFGRVFRAEQDRPVRRSVALKIIKLGMDTRQVIARFEAERQALAIMDHPCIAKVLDAGATVTGRPYFVMELVHGVPITRYCDEQRLGLRQRLELFIPVCQAVQHAHQKGIIHRDLKPSNVMVTMVDGRPVPKVIDFGIAKATAAGHRLTERTLTLPADHPQLIGTPAYMSPEQATLGGDDVDTRSDIYSLGVLLYELLTGTTPFEPKGLQNATYADLQRLIREVDPPRPSTRVRAGRRAAADERGGAGPAELRLALRRELDWIVMRCLEKDRGRRYDSAGALAEDLAAYLVNKPVSAAPPSRVYQARKFARRHAIAIGAAAAVVTAMAAALLVSVTALQRLRVEQQRTRAALVDAELQRQDAIAANETAVAINEFVNDMLASADPENALGRAVTVEELLHQAAERVDADFRDRPRVEAGIRETIGRTYASLNSSAAAAKHLSAAYAIRQSLGTANDADYLPTKATLAIAMHSAGEFGDARRLFEEVVEQAKRELERDGEQLVPAVDVLARSASYVNVPAARLEALFAIASDRRQKLLGPDHADSLLCRGMHAWYVALGGDAARAEPMIRQTLDDMRRALGPADRRTLDCQDRLARLLAATSREDEALLLRREALAVAEAQHGFEHPITLGVVPGLATLLDRRGEYEEALGLQLRRAAAGEKVYGAQSMYVATACQSVGDAYEKLGRADEALEWYRRRHELTRAILGDDAMQSLFSSASLGEHLYQRQKYDEAIGHFDRVMPMLRAELTANSPRLLQLEGRYALMLQAVGRAQEATNTALAAYQTATRLYPEAAGAQRAQVASRLVPLGLVLVRQGRFAEAEAPLRHASARLAEAGQGRGAARAVALRHLATVCRATGRPGEAIALEAEAAAAAAGGASAGGAHGRETPDD